MALLLRIDVDNPYVPRSRIDRLMNVLRNDLEGIVPALPGAGYLGALSILCAELGSRGVPATCFFRRSTVPTQDLVRTMTDWDWSLAFHATRASKQDHFLADLKAVKKHLPEGCLRGFSKHGSGELKLGPRHTPEYDVERLLALGKDAGLEYFSGNLEDPTTLPAHMEGMLIFPSAFWLKGDRRAPSFDLDWVLGESEQRPVVCLLHPKDYAYYDDVRFLLEKMLDRADEFRTFDYLLDQKAMRDQRIVTDGDPGGNRG